MNQSTVIVDKLRNDGYELGKKLGRGQYGSAFALKNKNDRVLKITTDVKEAQAMGLIRDNPHPNIVKVYKVWMYRSVKAKYFIEQDRLDKIDTKELKNHFAINYITDSPKELLPFVNSMNMWTVLVDFIEGKISKKEFNEEDKLMKRNLSADAYKTFNQLKQAVLHMKKIGIKGWDLHHDNVMGKNGKLVAIDLGNQPSIGKITDIREYICQR